MSIPFNRTFYDYKKDKELFNNLIIEMVGILNFALVGLKRLQANHYQFTESKSITKLMEKYKIHQNPTIEFFNDMYVPSENECMKRSEIYPDFEQWAENKGYDKICRSSFWNMLKEAYEKNLSIRLEYKKIKGFQYLCSYKKMYQTSLVIKFYCQIQYGFIDYYINH